VVPSSATISRSSPHPPQKSLHIDCGDNQKSYSTSTGKKRSELEADYSSSSKAEINKRGNVRVT
jgi:hypothetical protein